MRREAGVCEKITIKQKLPTRRDPEFEAALLRGLERVMDYRRKHPEEVRAQEERALRQANVNVLAKTTTFRSWSTLSTRNLFTMTNFCAANC